MHAQSTIGAFALHSYILSNYFVSGQWMPWSDCADAQADLGLRCPHMPEDMFSHGAAHISHVIVSKCRKTNKPKLVSSGVANTHLRTCVVGTEFSLFACSGHKKPTCTSSSGVFIFIFLGTIWHILASKKIEFNYETETLSIVLLMCLFFSRATSIEYIC